MSKDKQVNQGLDLSLYPFLSNIQQNTNNNQETHQENQPQQILLPGYDEPLYVNARQYHRILRRREARTKWEQAHQAKLNEKTYTHESRHKHAVRRPRGPGGRFLSQIEIKALKATGRLNEDGTIVPPPANFMEQLFTEHDEALLQLNGEILAAFKKS
ncbi:CCAAT-binding transcription factor (CBF-B/NF-YA) subunit B-domain-containing protein [Globomyces pollinis-pini]|nr:CCAAT-binding transcription factor (CBF-B/NF-YA) subunit B-domain-containing protein [Globomyces pollinis-pini]